jgi:hypothetical protein
MADVGVLAARLRQILQASEEHTPPALLAHERAAYEAPNTLLKDLHFERLRRLTLADDDGPRTASRWHFQ